jgi:Family of unknown function (DUF6941)
MSEVHPTVRYLILCENVRINPSGSQVSLDNLVSVLRAHGNPPFPMVRPELCVFVQLVECRGTGKIAVRLVEADSESVLFQTPDRTVVLGNDPLAIKGLSFRIRNCPFPAAGLFLVQFLYNDEVLAEQTLLVR